MIYTSCIKQLWTSAKVKTVNNDVRLQALVDEKKVVINEASIRRDLRLDDAEGTAPSKFRTTSPSQPPHAKDKGKGIMVEPEKPLKKKDQIALDEEVARKLEAKMKAKMEKKK
nr:hypothetical protein [Tanacetum cinerariifolium]